VCTLRGALTLAGAPALAPESLPRVGDYELLEELARGGVGVVFRARQLSLGRTVAVKLLLAGLFADPRARQRFRTEAQAAARIRHPNVVGILEVGEHEGQPFLAMEYMEGGTLARKVANGPLPATVAAAYLAKIARAVDHAHALGVLHRDLKPSNILLDAYDEPRVTDFGLAKVLDDAAELTLPGEVLGSPAFMAPEQAAGRAADVGPATDIYALGALLYHLTTGRPPFASDRPATVLRMVEQEDPVPPRRLNPTVPRDLETVIRRCLEKHPARRYPSAGALAEDLDRFLAGRPVTARPLSPLERAWRWSRRRKALTAALLLLAALAAGSLLAALRIRQAEKAARENFHRAEQHLARARLSAYAGDMALADRAIEDGDLARTRELLEQYLPQPGEPDLRTFEWRLLWQASQDQALAVLRGHAHVVSAVAFLDQGARLLSGSWDGTVRIWSVAERTPERTLNDLPGAIWAVDVSADSARVLASGESGLVAWRTSDWQVTARVAGNFSYGHALFLPGGERVVIAWRGGAGVWDLASGQRVVTLTNAASPVALSPDGRLLAARQGRTLTLFETAGWQPVKQFRTGTLSSFGLRDLAFWPDGRRVVLGDYQGWLGLLNLDGTDTNLTELARSKVEPQPHRGWVSQITFAPGGRFFASVGADQQLLLWRTNDLRPRATLRGHRHEVWAAAFSPDGALLASAGKDETIRLWDVRPSARTPRRLNLANVLGVWSDDAVLAELVSGGEPTGHLRVVHRDTAEVRREILLTNLARASGRHFQPQTGDLALHTRAGEVEVWQLRPDPPQCRLRLTGQAPGVSTIGLAPDGNLLAVYEPEGHGCALWEVPSGARRFVVADTGGVLALDQRYLVCLPNWQTPRVLDARTGRRLTDLVGHKERVSDAVLLPDSPVLVTAAWDGTLRFWELPTGRLLALRRSQRQGVYGLALSPDHQTLAAVGQDGTVRFWNLATRQETIRWIERGPIWRAWFTPDGHALLGSTGQQLFVLRAPALPKFGGPGADRDGR
jgi:WD40 repeat protein